MHLPEPTPRLEIGKVVHHLGDRRVDAFQVLRVERAALGVALGEHEAGKRYVIEVVHERTRFLQAELGLIGGLRRIADERALVEALRRRQRGLVTEQHIEKVQGLHVAPEHNETYGKWHGEQEAERSP